MTLDRFISLSIAQAAQIAVVIALVALVTSTLARHRPRLAYAMWLLVLVKCVTPPLWSSWTGVFSWIRAEAPRTSSVGNVVEPTVMEVALRRDHSRAEQLATSPIPQARRIGWQTVALVAWAIVATLLFIRVIGRFAWFRRRLLTSAEIASQPISATMREVCSLVGVRREIPVLITPLRIGPAVVGLLSPIIVIPRAVLSSADREQLRSILAHELIHVRRCDHWIAALQAIVQAIWWFHPMVWWMNRRINQARELSCDEDVIATLHCDPPSYVQMLLNVIHLQRKLAPPPIGVGMRSFDITRRRIDHLMNADHFGARRIWTTWLIFTIGLLVLLPGAGLAISEQAPTTAPVTASGGRVRFEGLITDFTTKQPIADARVVLVSGGFYDAYGEGTQAASGPTYEGTTGADGKVSIDIPLAGTRQGSYVDIKVYHPKYAPRTAEMAGLWKDGKPRDEIAREKSLIAGEEISGIVEDPDGKPLPDVRTSVRSIAGDEGTRFLKQSPELSMDSSVTDEHGRFRFNVVKDAKFATVWAEPSQFAIATLEVGNRRGDIGAIRTIGGTRITGVLLDDDGKPAKGVHLEASSSNKWTQTKPGAYERRAISDAEGKFTFDPLPPAEYRVAPADNRFSPQSTTITSDMTALALTFRAAEQVTVRGRLIRAKDAPRNRQPFEVFGGEGATWFNGRATTDIEGSFEFRVPKGLTNVEFNPSSGNDGYVYQWKRGEDGKLRGGEIKLASLDADVADLFMIEQRAASLTIKATGSDGNALNTNIGAEIRYADPDLWQPWGSRWQDNTQRGDVPIEYVDNYKRAVIKRLVPDRQFTVTIWVRGYEPTSQTLELKEGESREIEIKLTPQGTR